MSGRGSDTRLRRWVLPVAAAALVCLAGGVALAGAEPQEAEVFRFNPPDGTRFTETVGTLLVADTPPGRTITIETVLDAKVVITTSESGHTVAATIVSVVGRRNREQVGNVVLDALKGVTLTYRIDREGRMTDVEGVEDVRRRFGEAFPRGVVASVSKMLDKPVFLASEQADWRRRVGNLIGRPTRDGSAWLTTEEFALPSGGTLTYYVAGKVDRHVRMAGHDCVRVLYEYATDPQDLRELLGEGAEAAIGDQKALTSEGSVSGSGHDIVDPATLLSYGARRSWYVETIMPVPGAEEMPVTLQQTRTYEYRYER